MRRLAAGFAVLLALVTGAAAEVRAAPPADAIETLPGGARVLEQWRRAQNRGHCAPLAFAEIASPSARARRATFSGGWAVAFDLPGLRSAFGIAGTGTAAPTDDELAQWPLHLAWPGGRAGYGLSGRKPYAPDDPDGAGQESLAYLRIDGQGCLYNVWSRLGRAHLELLLRGLRPLAAP